MESFLFLIFTFFQLFLGKKKLSLKSNCASITETSLTFGLSGAEQSCDEDGEEMKNKSLAPVVFPSFLHQFHSPLTHVDHSGFCCILLEHNQKTGFPNAEPRVVSHTRAHAHAPLTLGCPRDAGAVRIAPIAPHRPLRSAPRERLHQRAHPRAEPRT